MSLEKKLHSFIYINGLVIVTIVWTLVHAWQAVNESLKRMEYAEEIESSAHLLQQYISTEEISIVNVKSRWLESQRSLSLLLKSPPELNAPQSTFFNSVKAKNESILILYRQLQRLSNASAQEDIKHHLRVRLIMQVESILEDSEGLSTLAVNAIRTNLQTQMITIILVLGFGLLSLVIGAKRLTTIISQVIENIQNGMRSVRKGKYHSIKNTSGAEDFSEFIKQFNQMSEQLEKTTVTRDVLQQIVDERTAVLKEIANTDPLTQVANRRALFERGEMEFTRAKRHGTKFTILMLDCDWFKSINDRHGHPVGDKLLFHLCRICENVIREEDFIARYGGEEFVILLPHCEQAFGAEKAEAIRQSVVDKGLFKDEKKIEFSVSIGVASLGEAHDSFEALLSDADSALLKAKELGRNCVQIF